MAKPKKVRFVGEADKPKNKNFTKVIRIGSTKTDKEMYDEYLLQVVDTIKCCISDYNYTPTYNDWLRLQVKSPYKLTEENFNACLMLAALKLSKEVEEFYYQHGHKFSHPSIKVINK